MRLTRPALAYMISIAGFALGGAGIYFNLEERTMPDASSWDRIGFLMAFLFMLVVGLVGLYDTWAVLGPNRVNSTVSAYIVRWSEEYPVLAFSMGFVLGHLFFPMARGKG